MRAPSPLAAAKSPSYHLAAFHSSRLEALPQAAAQAAMPRLDGPLLGLLALQEQVPANWAQLVEARLREDWGVQHWCRWSVPAWHNGQDWVREGFGGLALVARLPHTELHSHPIGGYDETALASLGQQQEAGRLGVLQMASNTPFLTPRISKLQAASEAFLLGALDAPQPTPAAQLVEVAPAPAMTLARLPSYAPLGNWHRITAAVGSVVQSIDERPALDVLTGEAGQLLVRKVEQLSDRILVGFPASGEGDERDIQARRLTAINRGQRSFSVSDEVLPGMALCFCRRDAGVARSEADRILSRLAARLDAPPRAALLFSHANRNQGFMPGADDARLVRQHLGLDFPLFALESSGEILNTHLYTESAVLALFL